ncbi:hypothetical protein DCAR_0312471 [Daucus carota subsp. sativus]|uniref:Uncharacterized protein n=1 Tax=Daucus carota subsp. sativus TaxID=79200 RepID=A0A166B1I5_DAUCS|nr:hypothetical protein DCAR_0312471 [Daucus carota subsp. sativus]
MEQGVQVLCLLLQSRSSPSQYRGIAHALATVLREEGPVHCTKDGFLLSLEL